MKLIFRGLDISEDISEEYREIEFNFHNYLANFLILIILRK